MSAYGYINIMSLDDFLNRYKSRRMASRALGRSNNTVDRWVKSGATFQIVINSNGRPEIWKKV